jgi:hypothetical protein
MIDPAKLKVNNLWAYPEVNSIEDLKSPQGFIPLRFAFQIAAGQTSDSHRGDIRIKGGDADRASGFFLKPNDRFDPQKLSWDITSVPDNTEVLVVWLKNSSSKTEIRIKAGKEKLNFNLQDLLRNPQLEQQFGNTLLTVNYLLYYEVGEVSLRDLGIPEPDSDFNFAILADPQGGDPADETNDSTTRLKIHNAFIEESIRVTNELDPRPHFSIILCDFTDSQGQASNFKMMQELFSKLMSPIILAIGNHETAYRSDFTPGYNMEAFSNYFASQKAINGCEKLLYSFNAGAWHFIVWPDPLRNNFWQTHPHYFDWLEKDLEKNKDRPVIFFQHVPSHPIGIDPLVNYVESPFVRRTVLDILSHHGNVKYIFSGHVHIPLRASLKTARSYNGIKMVNFPAAGYRPRAFGEEDLYGGPTQGVTFVKIKGKNLDLYYKNVTGEVTPYPDQFPELDTATHAFWLNEKWRVPASDSLVNSNFRDGLKGWIPRFVYQEDFLPSQFHQVVNEPGVEGNALLLVSRKRPYDVPGQDRVTQSLNQVSQVVRVRQGNLHHLSFQFKPHPEFYKPGTLNGAFVWIEGYQGAMNILNMVYSFGKILYNVGGALGKTPLAKPMHFDLEVPGLDWSLANLDLSRDFQLYNPDSSFRNLALDRIVINLGVWTVNDGYDQSAGMYFADFSLEGRNSSREQSAAVKIKDDADIYSFRIKHIAGEHIYAPESMIYPALSQNTQP